jgi:Polyphosphate kinase 2 (PPK2)
VAPAILPRSLTRLLRGRHLGWHCPARPPQSPSASRGPTHTFDPASGKQRAKYGARGKLTEHYYLGFCNDDEYQEFLRSCPQFERMLIRSGIGVLKYWFSVSDDEQERRFQTRAADPKRRWKLSPMDIESRGRWVDYSRAKDAMFEYTDAKDSYIRPPLESQTFVPARF